MPWDFQNGVWSSCKYNIIEVMCVYTLALEIEWVVFTKPNTRKYAGEKSAKRQNFSRAVTPLFFKRTLFKIFCDNPPTVCEKVFRYDAYFMPVLEFLKSVVYSPRYVDVKSNCQFVYWIICVTRTLRKLQYLGFGYEFLQTVFCIN